MASGCIHQGLRKRLPVNRGDVVLAFLGGAVSIEVQSDLHQLLKLLAVTRRIIGMMTSLEDQYSLRTWQVVGRL
jgi:hypothetical protein